MSASARVLSFEPRPVSEDVFVRVLGEAVSALEEADIEYGMLGGVASAAHGRPRWTRDIDVLVAPDRAGPALDALAGAGFDTQRTDEFWLYKGMKDGVLVDVLFRTIGDIYFDEEMRRRVRRMEFKGVPINVLSPEDLLVIKAIAHDEQTPRHWHDALGIVGASDLDWDYLARRAERGARRVLSLLFYAQSNDLLVPESALRAVLGRVLT